jgi:hypothetical protein
MEPNIHRLGEKGVEQVMLRCRGGDIPGAKQQTKIVKTIDTELQSKVEFNEPQRHSRTLQVRETESYTNDMQLGMIWNCGAIA